MILSALLPLIIFTSSYTAFNTILDNNYDEVSTDKISFIYTENVEIEKIEFNYEQETSKLYFDTLAIDINYYNYDTSVSSSSSFIYFDEVIIELPFFSTNNISTYYFNFELDNWNVNIDTYSNRYIETFWNVNIEYYDETVENWQPYGTIYLESEVLWYANDINVDALLFYFNPSFELEVYKINEVYQHLKDTYDESYSLGYEEGFDEGFGLGRDVGYETGYHEGYEEGFDIGSGENKGVLNFIKSIFNTINDLGNVEILPYIKIWYIIGIPVILAVVRFALGWFR